MDRSWNYSWATSKGMKQMAISYLPGTGDKVVRCQWSYCPTFDWNTLKLRVHSKISILLLATKKMHDPSVRVGRRRAGRGR